MYVIHTHMNHICMYYLYKHKYLPTYKHEFIFPTIWSSLFIYDCFLAVFIYFFFVPHVYFFLRLIISPQKKWNKNNIKKKEKIVFFIYIVVIIMMFLSLTLLYVWFVWYSVFFCILVFSSVFSSVSIPYYYTTICFIFFNSDWTR